jgi:hypothetical protein
MNYGSGYRTGDMMGCVADDFSELTKETLQLLPKPLWCNKQQDSMIYTVPKVDSNSNDGLSRK